MMTEEEWVEEATRCAKIVLDVLQAINADEYDLVRAHDVNGKEMSGLQVGGRVLMLFVDDDKQIPLQNAGETLQ